LSQGQNWDVDVCASWMQISLKESESILYLQDKDFFAAHASAKLINSRNRSINSNTRLFSPTYETILNNYLKIVITHEIFEMKRELICYLNALLCYYKSLYSLKIGHAKAKITSNGWYCVIKVTVVMNQWGSTWTARIVYFAKLRTWMNQSGALKQKYTEVTEVRKYTTQLPCRIEVLNLDLVLSFWPHRVNSTDLRRYELTRRSGEPLIIWFQLTPNWTSTFLLPIQNLTKCL